MHIMHVESRKKRGGGAYGVLFPSKRANIAAFCLCDRAAGHLKAPYHLSSTARGRASLFVTKSFSKLVVK
jgi:hypothetical protein